MLKITKKVEYALIAIKHLQEHQDKLVPVSDISASYGIPKEILAKTLQKLVYLIVFCFSKNNFARSGVDKRIVRPIQEQHFAG